MQPLKITTCQARNTFPITAALTEYLQKKLHHPTTYVDLISWADRYRFIDNGEIDIGWVCGWPYALRIDQNLADIELLVAPVMAAERYHNQPIYFSDVVVREDSPFQNFFDLRGGRWAFNEPGSQSGCHIVRYYLTLIGEKECFFGQLIGSGGHVNSIDMVLNGQVDGAAIDSTVWDWEVAQRPELLTQLRVLKTLGPSAMPPLIIQKSLPFELRNDIRTTLLNLHQTEQGRDILRLGQLRRFAAVADSHYDDVRFMAKLARQVQLAADDGYYVGESSVRGEVIC